MEKIKMTTPLVEMDGDEMTRILWKMIKDELILPFVDLKTEYYDLGLPNRDATADQVTMDAALANKKYGVSVKCATITPNAQRMDEYKLHEMWKSPNGTIRAVLDGTVFRAPIMIDSIKPVVKNWKKPITIARHAYGDVYKCTEFRIPGAGKAELVFTGADGSEQRATVFDFEGAGVLQGQYNKDDSIRSFARSCFNYALDVKRICGSAPRIPSPKSTTIPSRISSRRCTTPSIRQSSRPQASPTSTASLTISLPALSAARAALSGPARTTTAT